MIEARYNKALASSELKEFVEHLKPGCSMCSLSEHENQVVIYRGNPQAKIMLVGEAPGAKEDQCGRPFTGPAGELLDRIFAAIDVVTEKDMFITNVVFCRPVAPSTTTKQNYTPKKEQIVHCMPLTDKLIELINPSIIIACGGPAIKALMQNDSLRVTQAEGKWLTHRTGKPLFCMMHPAAILHKSAWPEEQAKMKRKVWNYIKFFRDSYQNKI